MEGTRNSVGSGSTAPFTNLIWPGMVRFSQCWYQTTESKERNCKKR
jgi:hypothetical protein